MRNPLKKNFFENPSGHSKRKNKESLDLSFSSCAQNINLFLSIDDGFRDKNLTIPSKNVR